MMFSSYIQFLHRFRWVLAALFGVLFAWSIFQASHLKLKSDFKSLLPSDFQSVRDLDRIVERVGGTGSLFVAIESDDTAASIRFAEDLVAKLKAYPAGYINKIEYNVKDLKAFFEDNKYLYLKLDDLQEIRDRLDRRIQQEKLKHSGLYIDFGDGNDKDDVFNTKDIEEKYKSKAGNYENYIDGYFFGENGRLMAIVIRPPGSATGIEFSKTLVAKVQATIDELNPSRYHPSMKTGLAGNVLRAMFEYQTLIDDIVSTALLCISLVGLAVLIYFRKVRMVGLMAWAVINGVAWIFALTQLTIGYLTTQTAFLGSIIVGNGINYSLILMARYVEERRNGTSEINALQIAIPATFWGTLASALTTSVGFGVLLATDVRGFSHFGFIGGLGMFFCWIATYTILPIFLSISEDIWPSLSKAPKRLSFLHRQFSVLPYLTALLNRRTRPIMIAGTLLSIFSIPLLIHFIPNSLEYDFSKLRVKPTGNEMFKESELNNRIRAIMGGSMSPAILITDRMDQVIPLCDEIMRKNNLLPAENRVVDNCKTVHSYVPENQPEKLALLAEIRHLLDDDALNFLNDDQKKEVDEFKTQFKGKPLTLHDLPDNIISRFREKNGDFGKLVYVYPSDKISLWEKENLFRYTDLIRKNTLPTGEVLTASGDNVIFADLIHEITTDGPFLTVLSFLAICLVVILTFREKRASLYIIGTLLFGVLWMGGWIALLGIKINFFNFIAIPTTFGIGVDYGVNIYQRYKLEGKGQMTKVLNTTGGAVILCSITTIIGYFTLIIARNQALVSFGWIGIIGEITCLLSAMLFIPAIVMISEKRKKSF